MEYPVYIVITGYDGETLSIPRTVIYENPWNNPTLAPEKTLVYDDLELLYVFGEKTARRYNLLDGLNNIRRVMEYNNNEKLWDEYLAKLGGCEGFASDDGLTKANPDRKSVV